VSLLPRAGDPPHSAGRTRIKICGVRSLEIAQAAAAAGADAIGLVRVTASPRYVDAPTAESIARSLPPLLDAVTVVCDQRIEALLACSTGIIQAHGREDEAYLSALRASLPRVSIVRAIPFEARAVRQWAACPLIDAMLIEGAAPGRGIGFAHEELANVLSEITKPVILAGGLTAANVGEAIRAVRPHAVDVSSGVELSPGIKEPGLIHEFCAAVREADAAA
jgi:phosphoribosylanthranilate isomerase